MEWHKMDYLIFSELRMRKPQHNVPYEKQQELNKGFESVWVLKWVALLERVRNCCMLYISTHPSIPHGENI